jgi:hypothetical protein
MRGFERQLERMVDGVFSRAFRSSLRPVELGRRLVREIEDHRSVDVRGRVIVPNAFTFSLAPDDAEQFTDIHDALLRELADAAREYARDEGYAFMGPVAVELTTDPKLRTGRFELTSRLAGGTGGVGAGSLVLPDGTRIPLAESTVTIGRLPECEVSLADPNVSRRHAELRPKGDGFVVVDLGSTNGTRVNGAPVAGEHRLADGDAIAIGTTVMRFEAS